MFLDRTPKQAPQNGAGPQMLGRPVLPCPVPRVRLQSPRASQRGQALTEFCVAAAFVLVPLFLMIPLLGKYIDMKASTIQAARYASWERTVWYGSSEWGGAQKSDQQIAAEVNHRFFSQPSNAADPALKSTDKLPGSSATSKDLWHDHAGATMLSAYSAAGSRGETPGTVNEVLDLVRSAVNVVAGLLGANFKLDMDSMYTSTVTLKAQNTTAVQQATGAETSGFKAPEFSMRHVMVANGWSANGPQFVTQQIHALAPLTALSNENAPAPLKGLNYAVNRVQDAVGTFVEELNTDSLKLGGVVNPDAVPRDRLVGGSVVPPVDKPPRKEPPPHDGDPIDPNDPVTAAKTFQKAVEKFHRDLDANHQKIQSCKAAREAEHRRNYVYDLVCYTDANKVTVAQCTPVYIHTMTKVLRLPPGGLGKSYTPVSDADVNCHSELDKNIAALQEQLNSDTLQRPIKESDRQLSKDPSLKDDAQFMKERANALAQISKMQARIDILKLEKRIQDLGEPLEGNPDPDPITRRRDLNEAVANLNRLKKLLEDVTNAEKNYENKPNLKNNARLRDARKALAQHQGRPYQ